MSGTVSQWIEHYGVVGVFVTAVIEGEVGVLVGGAMAHLGKLNLVAVTLAAWSAAFLSAELFFLIGRSQRDGRLVHKVTDKRAFALALHWIERHPRLFCLLYRFVYGFRIVGPVTISLSTVSVRTFTLLNLVTALLWAMAGVAIGWFVGPSLASIIGHWFTRDRFVIASVGAVALLLSVISIRARHAALRRHAIRNQPGEPIDPASTAD